MGKITNNRTDLGFTKLQRSIFDEFSKDNKLTKTFYFTGGTALSAIYLKHRESDDLDFFSERGFDNTLIRNFIDKIAQKNNLEIRFTERYSTRIFNLINSKNQVVIKIDFNYYPYNRVKKGLKIKGVQIDSLNDIAINKLLTINDRTEVKDYVDLYFLLKEFTINGLIGGVKLKFKLELDIIMVAGNFAKVEQFEFMPRMIIPLTLDELKNFYIEKAKKIAKLVITD